MAQKSIASSNIKGNKEIFYSLNKQREYLRDGRNRRNMGDLLGNSSVKYLHSNSTKIPFVPTFGGTPPLQMNSNRGHKGGENDYEEKRSETKAHSRNLSHIGGGQLGSRFRRQEGLRNSWDIHTRNRSKQYSSHNPLKYLL